MIFLKENVLNLHCQTYSIRDLFGGGTSPATLCFNNLYFFILSIYLFIYLFCFIYLFIFILFLFFLFFSLTSLIFTIMRYRSCGQCHFPSIYWQIVRIVIVNRYKRTLM